jgi:hypothetical protein
MIDSIGEARACAATGSFGLSTIPTTGVIDLEFDDAGEAEAYLAALRRVVYSSQEASSSLEGGPKTRIVEVVEAKEYRRKPPRYSLIHPSVGNRCSQKSAQPWSYAELGERSCEPGLWRGYELRTPPR